ILKRIRIRQIQVCSSLLRGISAMPSGFTIIRAMRAVPVLQKGLNAVVGYNRPFPTLKDAEAAIAGYEGGGHSNANYLAVKVPEAEKLREGDYAALFHIWRVISTIRKVFDLGGSVGNLFYCYSMHLDFSPDLSWTVCDLVGTIRAGKILAKSR